MDILFVTERLRKSCAIDRIMRKTHGAERARRLRRRLDQLAAAEVLDVLRHLPGRCHELTGDRRGQLSIDLDGPYRLLFEPVDQPLPTKEDGGLDWTRVTKIRILGVEDTHD
jgi:proteic killer suppression protein